jgi:flagellar basal body-associated protein FliL
LRRKRPTDFTIQRSKTEERIKKEILTASNAILLSGTGTITDVFFLNFMIK